MLSIFNSLRICVYYSISFTQYLIILLIYFFLDLTNSEQILFHSDSENVCHKTFFDNKLDYYKKVSIFHN